MGYLKPNPIRISPSNRANKTDLSLSLYLSIYLTIKPKHPSLLEGLLSCTLCPHIADVNLCRSFHSSPFMRKIPSESVTQEFEIALELFVRREVSSLTTAVLRGVACKTVRSILVHFPSKFLSMHFISAQMVQPWSRMDTSQT